MTSIRNEVNEHEIFLDLSKFRYSVTAIVGQEAPGVIPVRSLSPREQLYDPASSSGGLRQRAHTQSAVSVCMCVCLHS